MEKYFDLMMKSPLFKEISEAELHILLNCLAARAVKYNKNDIIFSEDEKITDVGFVLLGRVHVLQDDFWGNRTILANIDAGNTFAEAFACAETERLPVSVIAVEACEIMVVDYAKIIKSCPAGCNFHSKLIKNMLYIVASKNVMLTKKIEHITKRSTREKLLSFLSFQATQNKSHEFKIPFDRQGLADYLAVDRSALSKELSQLRKEGVLSFNKNEFKLIKE